MHCGPKQAAGVKFVSAAGGRAVDLVNSVQTYRAFERHTVAENAHKKLCDMVAAVAGKNREPILKTTAANCFPKHQGVLNLHG